MPNYTCDNCQATFNLKLRLTQHMKTCIKVDIPIVDDGVSIQSVDFELSQDSYNHSSCSSCGHDLVCLNCRYAKDNVEEALP